MISELGSGPSWGVSDSCLSGGSEGVGQALPLYCFPLRYICLPITTYQLHTVGDAGAGRKDPCSTGVSAYCAEAAEYSEDYATVKTLVYPCTSDI